MILRILLYILYLFIPVFIAFVTMLAMNISSKKETTVSFTVSSRDLINPSYIFYSKPEDIMHKNSYYLTDEIIKIMNLNGYLDSYGSLQFDLEIFCNLNFIYEKKELRKKSFDEFILSFSLLNANNEIIDETKKCLNLFIDNLNQMLLLKFSKNDTIERINYNINVLDLIIKTTVGRYAVETEKYYADTRAQIIINTLNILEQAFYDAFASLNELKKDSKIDIEEYKIIEKLLDTLKKQEDILLSFDAELSFSEDVFEFSPQNAGKNQLVYYTYILNKLKEIKNGIIEDNFSLKIKNENIKKDIDSQNRIITPGFILFILLLSSLIIIIIEFLYRKFKY